MNQDSLEGSAAALREEFDHAFGRRTGEGAAKPLSFLRLKAGGESLALAASEAGELVKGRALAALPRARPPLLGLAGLRGVLLPVFSAAALLGRPAAGGQAAPGWLVRCGGREPFALAFDEFEGLLTGFPGDLHPLSPGAGTPHARAVLRTAGLALPLISLESVQAGLRGRVTDPINPV